MIECPCLHTGCTEDYICVYCGFPKNNNVERPEMKVTNEYGCTFYDSKPKYCNYLKECDDPNCKIGANCKGNQQRCDTVSEKCCPCIKGYGECCLHRHDENCHNCFHYKDYHCDKSKCEDGTGVNLYICGERVFAVSLTPQQIADAICYFKGVK